MADGLKANNRFFKESYGPRINVAVLDTGIFRHRDFDNRIVAFKDFVNGKNVVYDDSGHGTHVSGIIAGSGFSSRGKYRGIAPMAGIVSVKVLDERGNGKIEDVVNGINWILENKNRLSIKVVNVSFGSVKNLNKGSHAGYDVLVSGIDSLWAKGMVGVAAAGNNGPRPGTITIPGVSRKVITVGAFDDVKFKSGRGPTEECVNKPEILVTGTNIVACSNKQGQYTTKSGTSMAAPIVSGAVARLLYRNPGMTPGQVKLKIHDSAVFHKEYRHMCAWGVLNMAKFVR